MDPPWTPLGELTTLPDPVTGGEVIATPFPRTPLRPFGPYPLASHFSPSGLAEDGSLFSLEMLASLWIWSPFSLCISFFPSLSHLTVLMQMYKVVSSCYYYDKG